MQKIVELLWVKRTSGGVGKTANAVLFGFRNMLASHFFQPARRLLCPVEVKQPGAQHFTQINAPFTDRQNARLGVQRFNNRRQALNILRGCQISFADQNHIGKFDLINKQVTDTAFVFFTQRFTGFTQRFCFVVVA